jgi:hypothetical protein
LGTLIGGYNYSEQRVISHITQLQLTQDSSSSVDSGALTLSSSGGPYIVTHLVAGSTAIGDMAQLPRPLFVRRKSHVSLSRKEILRLPWFDSAGETVKAPEASVPLTALYYELREVSATDESQ